MNTIEYGRTGDAVVSGLKGGRKTGECAATSCAEEGEGWFGVGVIFRDEVKTILWVEVRVIAGGVVIGIVIWVEVLIVYWGVGVIVWVEVGVVVRIIAGAMAGVIIRIFIGFVAVKVVGVGFLVGVEVVVDRVHGWLLID
jgi:hypothetical protein